MKSKKLADIGVLPTGFINHFESRRKGHPGANLKLLSKDLSSLEVLMIRYGQLECGPGVSPIVPRCMTALPENFNEFIESELPLGI